MKFTGKLKGVSLDLESGKYNITFTCNEKNIVNALDTIQQAEILDIVAEKHRKKRSIDANRMLWACIGDIAQALGADMWEIYLEMLKRYGKFTYICVKPSAVDAVKAQWRESEEIGEISINGEKAVQMLCYFGSSTYDSKEFSTLLNGVISEMEEIGLQPPPSRDMRIALERLEKYER